MMKELNLFVAFLFFSLLGFGQDAIYLTNGSAFIGTITSYEQGGKVKITVHDSIELVFEDSQIEKIIQAGTFDLEKNRKLKGKGFYYTIQGTASVGRDYADEFVAGLFLENSVGHQFSNLFGLGVGVGIGEHDADFGEVWMLPVFGEIRSMPFGGNKKILFSLKVGYGSVLKNEEIKNLVGGLMVAPEIQFRFINKISENFDFAVSLGYVSQRISYEENTGYLSYYDGTNGLSNTYVIAMRRIKFGVLLNLWKK